MKQIVKQQTEPTCLTEFKQDVMDRNEKGKDDIDFESIKLGYKTFSESKDYEVHFGDFRKFLLQEQGFICCYCMQPIGVKHNMINVLEMKTEHFKPQNEYNGSKEGKPDLQVTYSNLLAACLGDVRKRKLNSKNPTHCDSLKLGGELQYIPNPASENFAHFATSISYIINESEERIDIRHTDENMLKELQGTNEGKHLNLNEQNLAKDRFIEWKILCNEYEKKVGDKWEKDIVVKETSKYAMLHEKQVDNQVIKVFLPFCQMVINLLSSSQKS
jgi:uncharacterized protein (TIGR02646 family)